MNTRRSARKTREFAELAEVPDSGGVATPRFDGTMHGRGEDLETSATANGRLFREKGSRHRYIHGPGVDLGDVR
jgi:hypothetical protein